MQANFYSNDDEVWNKVSNFEEKKVLQPYGIPRYIKSSYPAGF